jgi:hypothetical protein
MKGLTTDKLDDLLSVIPNRCILLLDEVDAIPGLLKENHQRENPKHEKGGEITPE